MSRTTVVGVSLFLLLASLAAPTRANMLVNGSFESGTFTGDANNAMSLAPGSTVITGWTVITSTVTKVGVPTPFPLTPSDGTYFLDLTGPDDVFPHGGVSQTIATVVSDQYRVTFDLGTNQSFPTNAGPITVHVVAGPASQNFTSNPPGSGIQWERFFLDFTATSTSSVISLTGTAGNTYIGLDNVNVIPEPASLALLGAGGLLLLRRSRR